MQNDERIRQRAHEIWEAAGKPEGEHKAHWEQACRELDAEADPSSPETDTSASLPKKRKN